MAAMADRKMTTQITAVIPNLLRDMGKRIPHQIAAVSLGSLERRNLRWKFGALDAGMLKKVYRWLSIFLKMQFKVVVDKAERKPGVARNVPPISITGCVFRFGQKR
jgi:hypothetical protein